MGMMSIICQFGNSEVKIVIIRYCNNKNTKFLSCFVLTYESLFINVCFMTDLRCLCIKTSLVEQLKLKIWLIRDVLVTY